VALKFAKTYPVALLARNAANFENIVEEYVYLEHDILFQMSRDLSVLSRHVIRVNDL
jgi:hypothetical protein